MSYISRAATTTWLSIYWCAATLFRAGAFLLGMCVLVLYLLPDFLPKRGSKPLTSPIPNRRLLPLPTRDGSDIFVIMPDGERVPVEPLAASSHAKAWVEVVSGAMVYEKTRLRD